MNARTDHASLADLADADKFGPSDAQIVDAVAELFDLSPRAAIERMICIDFVAVRREMLP